MMRPKKTCCAENLQVIVATIVFVFLGFCLFLILQNIPVKQMMYAFSANQTQHMAKAAVQPLAHTVQPLAHAVQPLAHTVVKPAAQHSYIPIQNTIVDLPITPMQRIYSKKPITRLIQLTPIQKGKKKWDRIMFVPVQTQAPFYPIRT
jgi:hypothetical protein